MEQLRPIDMLIHCGDSEGSEDYIRRLADCPVHIVAGNNDFFSELPKEDEFCIGNYHVLITHGHYYYISMGTEMLKEDARARGFNLVMFGHTHRPYLEQDQEFEGYIILPEASFAGVIGEVMQGHVWIGADRYQGYGECEITNLEAVDQPDWIQRYGYRQQSEVGTTLYLLLMAPTAMYNIWGENCGLDLELLKEQLGVEQLEIQACSTAMALFGGYNRTWKCRTKWERMYDRGSIFKLSCEKEAPSLEALQKIQEQGLGMRRAEGYGQVLFLRPELFEAIDRKAPLEQEASEKQQSVQQAVRRAKYRWVMEHSKGLYQNKFSKSQGGALQALCEKAKRRHGDCTELEEHLTKNLEKRGPEYRKRYVHVAALVKSVLESPLAETLSLPSAPDSVEERLQLLIMLFDHSRKMDQQDLQKGEV